MAGRHVGQRLIIARVTLFDSVKEGEAAAADRGVDWRGLDVQPAVRPRYFKSAP
jgi:hypothetical protein